MKNDIKHMDNSFSRIISLNQFCLDGKIKKSNLAIQIIILLFDIDRYIFILLNIYSFIETEQQM